LILKPETGGGEVLSIPQPITKKPHMVRELASLGADLNAQGNRRETPLYLAAGQNTTEMAKVLLGLGADPNFKCLSGTTALHAASSPAMARLLIKSGADVNAKDSYGNTPLHDTKRKDIIKVLVEAGANPRAENNMGVTPLDHNVYSKEETLRSLLPKSDKKELLDSLKDLQTAWKPTDCKESSQATAQQSEPALVRRRLM
jgi:ankyrin repeat protein